MMRSFRKILAVSSFITLVACQEDANVSLQVSNPLPEKITDAGLHITDKKILDALTTSTSSFPAIVTLQNETSKQLVHGQADDLNKDGKVDEAFFLLDAEAQETISFSITHVDDPTIEPRTQFTLSVKENGHFNNDGFYVSDGDFVAANYLDVPKEQEQDSKLAYMEGPLWENDRVGFRYYLDDRNRNDVFGKSQPAMALATISGDYHAISNWGTDVLKVSKSMGLGSIAIMTEDGPQFIDNTNRKQLSILSNGPFRSLMRTSYDGWQVGEKLLNVISDIEIQGGAHWSEQRLTVTGNENNAHFATGIVKHTAAPDLITGTENGVFFAYTWGKQSEQQELLGMAILIPEKYKPALIEGDKYSHLVSYQLLDTKVDYRFMAGWQRGTIPFKTQASFDTAVRKAAREYAQPIS